VKVGVLALLKGRNSDPDFVRTLGTAIEERGFESVWVPEHVVLFDRYDSKYPYADDGKLLFGPETGLLDPISALTFIAAHTRRIRLGTGVCLIPQRNPVYAAKQVADLDVLSAGRVELGIGVGWLKEEFDALNVPFARRGARSDEHLQIMKRLWTETTPEFEGEFYHLPPCRMYPKPVQKPHPPVHVGGESQSAIRRAAAHGQGWFTMKRLPVDLPEPLARLDQALAAHGRSRHDGDFELTVCPANKPLDKDSIDGYAALGVDRLLVVCVARTRDELLRTLDALVSDVLEPSRA